MKLFDRILITISWTLCFFCIFLLGFSVILWDFLGHPPVTFWWTIALSIFTFFLGFVKSWRNAEQRYFPNRLP